MRIVGKTQPEALDIPGWQGYVDDLLPIFSNCPDQFPVVSTVRPQVKALYEAGRLRGGIEANPIYGEVHTQIHDEQGEHVMMGQILAAQSGRRIAIDRHVDKIRLGLSLVSYTEGATTSARGGERQVFIRRDKFGPQFARLYFQALH